MKIEKRENVKGTIRTIVFYKNEKYVRLQKSKFTGLDMQPVVEWKKLKTNHIVKADKHKLLEDNFKEVDTISVKPDAFSMKGGSSGTTMFFDFKTVEPNPIRKRESKSYEEQKVDKEIIRLCEAGTKLAAVKFYKDFSGLGLKESKDYVDVLDAQRLAEKRWEEGMNPTRQVQADLSKLNNYFKSNSHRKQFIAEVKQYHKKTGGGLQAIKLIKDKTDWLLKDCKLFFDTYIK